MDPRVLMFLINTECADPYEVETINALIRLYINGIVEATWEGGQPLFSLTMGGDEEALLAYAYEQKVIEE